VTEPSLSIEVRDTLHEIGSAQWNALNDDGNPFVTHEFLYGLETTDCLGQHNGWYPRYFLLWQNMDSNPTLLGAAPCYVKTNSYGEFVFDWAWAEAFERNNMEYYPKLVCSIPFTPATGRRFLISNKADHDESVKLLTSAIIQFCETQKYSSAHWLFLTEHEVNTVCINAETVGNVEELERQQHELSLPPLMRRIDCQYHWHNKNYTSFDDFLAQCTSKRRKTIKRERRHVSDTDLIITRRLGKSLSQQEWAWVHDLYCSTFDRKWGNASLTLSFLARMGEQFGDQVLVVLAHDPQDSHPEQPVACSIMFIGDSVLYGRYWGCRQLHNSLHFEACYYQGIEFCIEQGLSTFEPGAQGEHKITRGFEPTITRSVHYISHPDFRSAIFNFLTEESKYIEQRCEGLTNLLPFKHSLNNQIV